MNFQRRFRPEQAHLGARNAPQPFRNGRQILIPHREPGRRLVPAVPHQQIGAPGNGVNQTETARAARAGHQLAGIGPRQRYRRPVESLRQPPRHQSIDPRPVSLVPRDDDGRRRVGLRRFRNGDFTGGAGQLPAFGIVTFQPFRQPFPLPAVPGKQQVEGGVGVLHTPGGIEPGRNPKGHILGAYGLLVAVNPPQQSLQPRTPRVRQPLQPLLHQIAVFVPQRHQIRHRAQRRQLGQRPVRRFPQVFQQRARHLVGNPGPAQLRARIAVARHPGVHNRRRIGTPGRRRVMVGYDHIGAPVRCQRHLGGVADAAVHRYDERRPLRQQLRHRRRRYAVPLQNRMRQIGNDPRPQPPQGFAQNRRSGDAVNIKIAENGHPFPRPDGGGQARQGGVNPRQQARRMRQAGGIKTPVQGRFVPNPPRQQQLRRRRRQPRRQPVAVGRRRRHPAPGRQPMRCGRRHQPQSQTGTGQHNHRIVPAEPERIAQNHLQLRRARHIGNIVQVALLIRFVQINGGRHQPVAERGNA